MICSFVNLLFLIFAILLGGGLLLLRVGMAGRGQVRRHQTITSYASLFL